jgi:spermidine/putrescine-binding protein
MTRKQKETQVADIDRKLETLYEEAVSKRLNRRAILARGMALGLSLPAIASVAAQAQDATPAPMTSPAQNGPVMVPIVGRDMTFDEIKAAIAEEGQLTVGNWTYTANDQLVARFQEYVQTVYGEEITLNYVASQQPATYITDLYTTIASGSPPTYDVMAIEENYWAEVQLQSQNQGIKMMEDFLPSGLIPNAERVLENLTHVPTAIGFQASATPGINYRSAEIDFLTDWDSLADERLKGKILGFLPGDITSGAILLGLAASLGKDYSNPDQMRETVDYWMDNIHPNVIKYTTDNAELQSLFSSGAAPVVCFWNSMARLQYLNGVEDAAFLVAESGQFAANGFMWIPASPQHPVLAQIFIDWRLSDDAQFPDLESWGITEGAWAELHEGYMGESYVGLEPDWIKDAYANFFPTIEQLSTNYKSIDWNVYAANSADWFDYWLERLGL